jgi:hypothetical protein
VAKLHGKNTRVYVDGYDVSADSNSLEPSYQADTVDISCFTNSSKTYVVGLPDPQIRQAGVFNDAGTTGIHDLMKGRVGSMVALDTPFSDALAAKGVGGTVALNEYSVSSQIAGAVTVSAAYSGGDTTGVWEFLSTVRNKGALLTGTSGAQGGADLGTAFIAANGTVSGHLQLFGGTGTAVIQSSPDDTTWTNRITYAWSTGPLALRALYNGGTVPRYWRATINGTGTAWAGLSRIA